MEFWFAIIKVVAIVGMIGFGAYLLATGAAGAGQRRQPVAARRLLP
jgi:L-asparagine transporter-like permease